jgi:hypothetical protein
MSHETEQFFTELAPLSTAEKAEWVKYLNQLCEEGIMESTCLSMPEDGFLKVKAAGMITDRGLPTITAHYRFLNDAPFFD